MELQASPWKKKKRKIRKDNTTLWVPSDLLGHKTPETPSQNHTKKRVIYFLLRFDHKGTTSHLPEGIEILSDIHHSAMGARLGAKRRLSGGFGET